MGSPVPKAAKQQQSSTVSSASAGHLSSASIDSLSAKGDSGAATSGKGGVRSASQGKTPAFFPLPFSFSHHAEVFKQSAHALLRPS